MPEAAHLGILDRDESIRVISENFGPQIALVGDLANFGSNLILRAYNSSAKGLGDAMAIGVLLRQVVAMIDSTEIQLSAGAVHGAFLPARAAFEASIYMQWMLVSDLEKKARYYYVANLRHERMWAKRCIEDTEEHTRFFDVTTQLCTDLSTLHPNLSRESEEYLVEVNRILAQPDLVDIDKHFDECRGKRKFDPNWHEPLGVTSLRQMAQLIRRLPEYELLYTKGSRVTHGSSYKDFIKFSGNRLIFKPIRNLEDLSPLLHLVITTAYRTYEAILGFYRADELRSFSSRYMKDWRDPFLSIKKVVYEWKP